MSLKSEKNKGHSKSRPKYVRVVYDIQSPLNLSHCVKWY